MDLPFDFDLNLGHSWKVRVSLRGFWWGKNDDEAVVETVSDKFTMDYVVDMMLDRLKGLTYKFPLLSIIVATRGLNAAMVETENSNLHRLSTVKQRSPIFSSPHTKVFLDNNLSRAFLKSRQIMT